MDFATVAAPIDIGSLGLAGEMSTISSLEKKAVAIAASSFLTVDLVFGLKRVDLFS